MSAPQPSFRRKKLILSTLGVAIVGAACVFTWHWSDTHNRAPSSESPTGDALPASMDGKSTAPESDASFSTPSNSGESTSAANTAADSADSATAASSNAAAPAAAAPTVAAPVPQDGCHTVTYRHEKKNGHTDFDSCSQHKNVLKLALDEASRAIDSKSVCVRVDGVPVNHEFKRSGKGALLTLGGVAGPGSVITARYCTGSAKCAEDCTVPRDEFMEAIGGHDAGTAAVAAAAAKKARWNPDSKEPDTEVSEELEAEIQRELSGGAELATFDGWKAEAPTAACIGTKVGQSH